MISRRSALGLILCAITSPSRLNAADPTEVDFEKEIRPLLVPGASSS